MLRHLPILFLVQEMTARLALATGKGHVELVRSRTGRAGPRSPFWNGRHQLRGLLAEFAGIALGAGSWASGAVAIVGAGDPRLDGPEPQLQPGSSGSLSCCRWRCSVSSCWRWPAAPTWPTWPGPQPLPSDVPHDYFALVVAIVAPPSCPGCSSISSPPASTSSSAAKTPWIEGGDAPWAVASQALMAAVVIAAAARNEVGGAGLRLRRRTSPSCRREWLDLRPAVPAGLIAIA